jgi:hypothetical protein
MAMIMGVVEDERCLSNMGFMKATSNPSLLFELSHLKLWMILCFNQKKK